VEKINQRIISKTEKHYRDSLFGGVPFRASASKKEKFTAKKLALGLILLSVFLFSQPAKAISLISDQETETFLHQTLRPVFAAAGVTFNPESVYIVNDRELNAFVSEGNRMFVNIGTLISADSQNELTGVLAHETGHIQGGHILRHKVQSQQIQYASLASMIVGGIAGIAAGRPDIGIAAIIGSQGSALNSMLTYQVSEERSADEAAVDILQKINQSPAGMLNFMKKIQKNNRLQGIKETNWFRTHPISTERIAFLEEAVQKSTAPANGKQEAAFQRIKIKLKAYINSPEETFKNYPLSDQSANARYAQAIAYSKQANAKAALQKIDSLLQDEPHNPYFYELKGQILLESGRLKPAAEAYRQALRLIPSSATFKLNLVQVMIEDNPDTAQLQYIINLLNQILVHNPDSYAWLYLARAYGLKNDLANSNYAAAEFSLRSGDIPVAVKQLAAAEKATPSPALRLKLEDLKLRIKQIKEEQPPQN